MTYIAGKTTHYKALFTVRPKSKNEPVRKTELARFNKALRALAKKYRGSVTRTK